MDHQNNLNVNEGVQLGAYFNSTVTNPTYNYNVTNAPPQQQSDLSQILAPYKKWILDEEENSQLRRKLKQLNVNGELCYIERKLKGNGEVFSAEELLKSIPRSKTSLVTGPAGSGKSILAARITVAWAESLESIYDVVLFLSALHTMDNLPPHKMIWGEYASLIGKDSERIYQELLEMKNIKILVIIDGLGI